VVDGLARPLPGHLGSWADGNSHAWKAADAPAWIELSWNSPVEVGEIHLCFDSGLDRELMLSASDHSSRKIIRGPQPEIVKSYELHDGEGRLLAKVEANHQRRRIHRFSTPIQVQSVRCTLLSTHGARYPALQEMRVYGPVD
jgi:sporulation-control protein spo0M